MVNEFEIKKMICDVGRRIYNRNMVAANDGNISVKNRHQKAGPEAGRGEGIPHRRHQPCGDRSAQSRPHPQAISPAVRQNQAESSVKQNRPRLMPGTFSLVALLITTYICYIGFFSYFPGKTENFPLQLGKLMLSSKGWRVARRNYYARCSVLGESCIFSTPPTHYLASGEYL